MADSHSTLVVDAPGMELGWSEGGAGMVLRCCWDGAEVELGWCSHISINTFTAISLCCVHFVIPTTCI